MYQITKSAFGQFALFKIENPDSGNGFSIVPEVGGTVLDIWFDGQSVLDGYQTPDELAEGKWGKCAILFPFPNRMRDGHYHWNGQTYTFPVNNAATNNAIHGFVRHQSFGHESGNVGDHSASFSISYDYDGHLEYYPFPFTLKITFTIGDDHKFAMETQVTNHHSSSIPVGFGWHPYFQMTERVEDSSMRLPDCEKVEIDDRMLPNGATTAFEDFSSLKPIGDTFLDNCFLAKADYTLVVSGGGRQLKVEASQSQFPYFQVFTPPHRTCVALEPMSCNVDAFNNKNGLVELAAGETWGGKFVVKVVG